MSRPIRITVTVAADGQVHAETQHTIGEQCLPYLNALEDLLGAETVDSAFTEDWWKTAGAPMVTQQQAQARLDQRG
ncbi:DUF2997 domain-containing protein [Nocardia sp. NPDC057663]|uniref:DUF2997 domain-containing protein n=1 Tax=Nocardia sp. NPDC057663 TaxID=3346201 RepID=UPI003670B75E